MMSSDREGAAHHTAHPDSLTPAQFYALVATRLRASRSACRLTRRGLASLLTRPDGELDAWEQRVYKYETGRTRPPLHAAWLLTGALGISLHALCEPRIDRARIHDVIVRLPPDRLPAALAAVRSLLD